MKRFAIFLIGALVASLLFALLGIIPQQCFSNKEKNVFTDTVIVYDTVKIEVKTPVDSVVIRYAVARLPEVVISHKKNGADTTFTDTAQVSIPIVQKEYQDSLYHAWVSGYNPNLDSLVIYNKTKEIVRETIINKPYKQKRWGIGVQVGAGVSSQKISPYIGIGVHYNIFSW